MCSAARPPQSLSHFRSASMVKIKKQVFHKQGQKNATIKHMTFALLSSLAFIFALELVSLHFRFWLFSLHFPFDLVSHHVLLQDPASAKALSFSPLFFHKNQKHNFHTQGRNLQR